VIAGAATATGVAVWRTIWRPSDVLLFAALATFGAAAIELSRRTTEPAGLIKDVHGIWQLPMALLLPPAYCVAAPVITFTLLQMRTRRTIVHRQVFSAAANGLSLGAAAVAFRAIGVPAAHPALWLLAAVATAVVWSAANKTLVMTAVWVSDRTVSVRDRLFSREPLFNDTCEITTGVLLAGALAGIGLFLLPLAFPLVFILQRSLRHAQLRSQARLDADTGLLNAAAWRAEAIVHLADAQRTGAPIAVALADLDHCHDLTAAHGWRAGDVVLGMVAATLKAGLRSSDLIGRFGGEEFAILLPSTTHADAVLVTDRLRRSLAAQTSPAGPDGQPVHVTISIGIAAIANVGDRDITDLLLAADTALTKAKTAGRDRVCLFSDGAEHQTDTRDEDDAGMLVRGREEITAALCELGAELARLRDEAGLTQQQLAERTGYGRSTLAHAEGGRPMKVDFWTAMDRALNSGRTLARAHGRIEAAVTAERRQATRRAWIARAESAELGVAGGIQEDGAVAVQDGACPSCGEPIIFATHVITTTMPPTSRADPSHLLL
jgi:diguanylate cyclase (GGDEF)-like protein